MKSITVAAHRIITKWIISICTLAARCLLLAATGCGEARN